MTSSSMGKHKNNMTDTSYKYSKLHQRMVQYLTATNVTSANHRSPFTFTAAGIKPIKKTH